MPPQCQESYQLHLHTYIAFDSFFSEVVFTFNDDNGDNGDNI